MNLNLTNLKAILFEDEATLFTNNTDVQYLTNICRYLEEVKNWLIVNRLTVNAKKKTHYIILTWRILPENTKVTLDTIKLERKSTGKFLGITLKKMYIQRTYFKYDQENIKGSIQGRSY